MALVAAVVVAATLHAGQTRWFAPGQLRAGDRVACVGARGRSTMTVPRAHANAGDDAFSFGGRGPKASIELRSNGAAEVDCGTTQPPLRSPSLPYVVGPHGLGLLRGTNTLARVRALYGPGTVTRRGSSCRVAWPRLGLSAVFAGCRTLAHATVTGHRWSSLAGVRIGDPLARMLWQDVHARRFGRSAWRLGGVGAKQPPRLVATLGPGGAVVSFTVVTG